MTDKARTRLEARWGQARSRVKEGWGRISRIAPDDIGERWDRLVRRLRRRGGQSIRAIEPELGELTERSKQPAEEARP